MEGGGLGVWDGIIVDGDTGGGDVVSIFGLAVCIYLLFCYHLVPPAEEMIQWYPI